MTLVELCAGSAAVSLRWLSARARPPLAYQGGKRGYADQILHALGLQPGGGKGQQVVLCEPGPWGEAWSLWRTAEGRADTIARLEAWQDEDPRTLWERLRSAPVPGDERERVAVWAVLQFWSFGQKPVRAAAGRWRGASFNSITQRREETQGCVSLALPLLMTTLRALPDLSRLTVHRCRAEEITPIPGAVVLIDPPYQGTTCAYEPALEAVNFTRILVKKSTDLGPDITFDSLKGWYGGAVRVHEEPGRARLDWVIVGGESGSGARPFDLAWARSAVAQCRAAGVPAFVKQLGAVPVSRCIGDVMPGGKELTSTLAIELKLRDRKGGDMDEWPEDLRVRQWPEVRG